MNNTTMTMGIWYDVISHDTGLYHLSLAPSGLCYVALPNESFDDMKRALLKNIKQAEFIKSSEKLAHLTESLLAYLNGSPADFSFRLTPYGTPFQSRVWDVLKSIPYGSTITYSDVAKKIGQESAVRAVASAIGSNPLPIVIPCHRVIGKDGDLRGYRGGLSIKRFLIDMERNGGRH